MEKIKKFLNWAAGVPPVTVQEAERYNKLDQSVARMVAAHDEFALIVGDVVRDLGAERRQRRAYEKVTARSRKT